MQRTVTPLLEAIFGLIITPIWLVNPLLDKAKDKAFPKARPGTSVYGHMIAANFHYYFDILTNVCCLFVYKFVSKLPELFILDMNLKSSAFEQYLFHYRC
jgi:hypothetical protein